MNQATLITNLKRIVEDCTTNDCDGKPCQTQDGMIIELAITEIESLTRNAEVCVYREIAPVFGIPQKVGFIEQTKERIRGLEAGLAKVEAALAQAAGNNFMTTQKEAVDFIVGIRQIQELKHSGHTHTIPEWLLIIRRQLQKAEDAWYRGDDAEAFQRVGHVTASGLAAIEQNGHAPAKQVGGKVAAE